MNQAAFDWVISQNIKCPAKAVLLALAFHADSRWQCVRSLSGLAFDAGASLATVKRALNTLEASGLVSRQRQTAADGGNDANHYQLHLHA